MVSMLAYAFRLIAVLRLMIAIETLATSLIRAFIIEGTWLNWFSERNAKLCISHIAIVDNCRHRFRRDKMLQRQISDK